jgi:hypothetical protein
MPIHDWTRVEAGAFHAFHHIWITALCSHLNHGCLPPGYFALPEQRVQGPEADVLALETNGKRKTKRRQDGGTAVIDTPPRTRMVEETESELYARKADRIAVHHHLGNVVAFIEIVSPGNKGSRHALRSFVEKTTALLEQGIHLLIIDLFPPSKRDPQGIHRAIFEEIGDTKFKLPASKPLTLVAYSVGMTIRAYIEPVAVGDDLPDMPQFLKADRHVKTPLEQSYQATWDSLPVELRDLLE